MIVIRPILRQYAIVIAVNLIILCMGLDMAWTSPALVKLQNPGESPFSRPITDTESGWIVSIGYIISIFTLPCTGFLVDYIGRKRCILIVSLPKIVAGMITIFATEVEILLVARAINLTMNLTATMVIMIYSTEIANKEIRGSLGSVISISSCLGSFLMLSIGPYISYLNLNIFVTAITVCMCIPLLFIPDTPYSLYTKGKIEEAKNVLVLIRGSEILAEAEIKDFCQKDPNQKIDAKDIFKNKTYIKAFLIVVLLGIGVQMNGFYFIYFYLQTILESLNTNVSSALSSVIIGFILVLSSIFAGALSDKFGRKLIIISSLLGMTVGMIGLVIFFALKQHGIAISGFLNYLPLISIGLIMWCHSGGVSSQYVVLITELLDDRIRALGTSACLVTTTASIFLVSRYTLTILSALGPVLSFAVFGVICITISILVVFFVPETKQKTIADIQRDLRGQKESVERKDRITRF